MFLNAIKIDIDNILLFDMDGTLINTDYANFLSYKYAIQKVCGSQINIKYDSNERFNRNKIKKTIRNLSEDKYEEIVQLKEESYNKFLCKTKICEDVVNILHKYQNKNKVILVTNSNKNRAVSTLNYHNLIDKFDDFYFGQILNDEEQINKFEKLMLNNRNIIDKFILFENEIEEIQKAILMGIPPKNIIRIKCE